VRGSKKESPEPKDKKGVLQETYTKWNKGDTQRKSGGGKRKGGKSR